MTEQHDLAAVPIDDVIENDVIEDDVIVLPWWQHPVNIVVMVVAAALIAGIAGWMIGDAASAAHNDVDTGFLQDMREHHEQGVEMAWIYTDLPDTNPGLVIVADSIVQGQTLEVGRMVQLLRDFGEAEANFADTAMGWMGMPVERGQMPGMATDEQLDQLAASSGEQADRLFAALMIAHHEGGVHMAEYAAEHGEASEVKRLAESIVAGQRSEIAEIEGELAA